MKEKIFLLLLLCFLCHIGNADANEKQMFPKYWPWKSINIDAMSGNITDLIRLKKDLGIKTVRLDIEPRWISHRDGIDGQTAFNHALQWADKMLDMCAELHIGAIVHIGIFPFDANNPVSMNQKNFWTDKLYFHEVVNTAALIAKRWAGRGKELLAYQVLSEPVEFSAFGFAERPSQWPELQQQIIDAIRRYDQKRWIVVADAPGGGPRGYKSFMPPKGERLIWGVHMYLPHAFTHQGIKGRKLGYRYPGMIGFKYWDKNTLKEALEPLRRFQALHPGPVWVGEFSAVRWAPGGERYIKDLVSLFREYGWGWDYYSGTGYHGWNPDYDDKFSNDDPKSWKKDYVGVHSKRWHTLKEIYEINNK